MSRLTSAQVREYLHKNYTAADGLWFMKVEERYGFDTALDIDTDVWRVMPKIQARMLKSMLGAADGLEGLRKCLETKLELDGFIYRTEEVDGGGFRFVITTCPWHMAMLKSDRAHLSAVVGDRICPVEYGVWIRLFGNSIAFVNETRICRGETSCVLEFRPDGG